jgi:hypothetical protein
MSVADVILLCGFRKRNREFDGDNLYLWSSLFEGFSCYFEISFISFGLVHYETIFSIWMYVYHNMF